ncbi:MAG: fumarate reductase cytochrome b subunit [Sulfurospirillaceae bacterium]|nr:fumarate reductase cytochrome b subunit [Sulfurospirillaceae bacterium]
MSDLIEGFLGKTVDGKKSRLPAKLDYYQSATGLFLGLFMWGHMFFVSSILVSKDFMHTVTKMFEGSMFLQTPQPLLVSGVVALVFAIFIVHAMLGMRKLPSNFRQFQAYRTHMQMMKHDETTMWFIQAVTGFAMFFLGSAHLFMMMTKADEIGPFGSSDRMYSDFMWPFYLVLLFAVELHGSIGLYRLCVKWGWFEGDNAKQTRAKLKKVKWAITVFFLGLGLLTLGAYVKYGYEYSNGLVDKYNSATQIEKFLKVGK